MALPRATKCGQRGIGRSGLRYDSRVFTRSAGSGVTTTEAPAPVRVPRFTLDDCRRPDSVFASVAYGNAVDYGVEPRALMVRTLLHLPRVAGYRGQVSRRQIDNELRHRARDLQRDIAAVRGNRLVPADKVELKDLRFVELPTDRADPIFSRLHYLRSARPESLNFALVDPATDRPYTMCSVSPLEWKLVGRQLSQQFGAVHSSVWDVSRVFSFDLAPPNAISYLLAKVRARFRTGAEGVKLLVTAVDPNLGFTGSSYRAANWESWMTVQPRPYLYLDRRYASPRQLRARFGTANPGELKERLGHRFEQSRAKLLDSTIFCCRVKGETEVVGPADQRRLRR
jgi:hypothetical protein